MASSFNKYIKCLTPVGLVVFFIACGSNHTNIHEDESDLVKRSDMSELSLLMRRMDKLTAEWKQAVETQEFANIEIPNWLNKLHTAEATDPSEITEIYTPMADAWIESVKQFKDAPTEQKPAAFNTLVSNCINCHQHFCQGPIPKIRKLYVDIPANVSNSGN